MLADSNDSSLPEDSKESTGSKQAADGETRKNVCGKMILPTDVKDSLPNDVKSA